jgi:hypothetical protein
MKILTLRSWGKMGRIIRKIVVVPSFIGLKEGVIV